MSSTEQQSGFCKVWGFVGELIEFLALPIFYVACTIFGFALVSCNVK